MVKGKIKLLREAVANIFKCVTIDYPAGTWPGTKYSQIPPKLRGKPKFNEEKCIGCGACSMSCSGVANSYEDKDGWRFVSIFLGQCLFCGRCEEICPEEAIKLTQEFELSYSGPRESEVAYVRHGIELVLCENCGDVIAPAPQIARCREMVMEKIDPSVREIVVTDMEKYSKYCSKCRQILSHKLNTHTRKFY
ncbi:MAG: 4Fe-4S dicluster domain-containing protein [Candidatus Bathyarchaeia archaeon]